jgi:hypothetical protein
MAFVPASTAVELVTDANGIVASAVTADALENANNAAANTTEDISFISNFICVGVFSIQLVQKFTVSQLLRC